MFFVDLVVGVDVGMGAGICIYIYAHADTNIYVHNILMKDLDTDLNVHI